MQRCLRWKVSRTRRAGEALLPRSPSAQRGAERRSRRHSALEEVRTRRGGQTVWPFQRTTGLATCYVDFSRYCLADKDGYGMGHHAPSLWRSFQRAGGNTSLGKSDFRTQPYIIITPFSQERCTFWEHDWWGGWNERPKASFLPSLTASRSDRALSRSPRSRYVPPPSPPGWASAAWSTQTYLRLGCAERREGGNPSTHVDAALGDDVAGSPLGCHVPPRGR